MGEVTFRAVARRAFSEAADFVRWPKANAVVTTIAAACGAALLTWWKSGVVSYSVAGGLVGVAGLLALTFLVKLFTVPLSMIREMSAAHATDANELEALRDRLAYIDPEPNMTVRELFFYLDDDVLNSEREAWIEAGQKVMDALSMNRLYCWGRLLTDRVTAKPALQQIGNTAWASGDFTFSFFLESNEMAPHFNERLRNATREWADLRFNRREVANIWPKA